MIQGDDNTYQLSPSIAVSNTDLYVVWQERNRDTLWWRNGMDYKIRSNKPL